MHRFEPQISGLEATALPTEPQPLITFSKYQFNKTKWGRGGGQVVSVLAFYSDDPSSSPAEGCSFFCKICV